MILPTTASTVWILAIVSLLCLGSWANTLKLAGKWRFEYFYCDFVFGILLSAVVAAFLLGLARPQDLTFQDNLVLTGYRKMAWALGSGVVLNLGTLLLLAAMTHLGHERGVSFDSGRGAGDRRGVELRQCHAGQHGFDVCRSPSAAGGGDRHRTGPYLAPAGPAEACGDSADGPIRGRSRNAPDSPGGRWRLFWPSPVESF